MQAIKWVMDNGQAILAAIGGAYALALLIVKLTPTPADDEALERVHSFVLGVAKLFGLKISTQAEKDSAKDKNDQTKGTKGRASLEVLTLLLLVVVIALSGCASAGEQYQSSSLAFVAAVDAATELRKAGKLEDAEVAAVGVAIGSGSSVLHAWGDALKDGRDYPDGPRLVRETVATIRAHLVAKKE